MKWVLLAVVLGIIVVGAVQVRVFNEAPLTVEAQMSQNDCWRSYVDKKINYGAYKLCLRDHTVK